MDETPSSATSTADMVSKASSYSYSRPENNFLAPENGQDQGSQYRIRWKSGEKVDQRLLTLLEIFFLEIYVKRREFFEKIFPELHGHFIEVFQKIGAVMLKTKNQSWKHRTLQRSLSLGSSSKESQAQGVSELRPQRLNASKAAHDDQGQSISTADEEEDEEEGSYSKPPPLVPLSAQRRRGRILLQSAEPEPKPKPKRFKVKTPKVIRAEPKAGQGGPSGSKSTAATNSN